ncbi:transposon Ty3-I Gag-Pol polyprotein [Trichonephila clavipes]|nr:transposon Ty3-I Gag-Pol polyprotein [Trichonephila clavipes]
MGLYSSEKSRSLRKTLKKVFRTVSMLRPLSAVTYEVQDFDPASRKRKLREVVHVLRMKPYHDPAEQIETEDIPPKESYKGPITRSRIKTLEQNDSGALSSFEEQCHTHNLLQVPIAELDVGLNFLRSRVRIPAPADFIQRLEFCFNVLFL